VQALGTAIVADRRGEDAALNYFGSAVGEFAVQAGGRYMDNLAARESASEMLRESRRGSGPTSSQASQGAAPMTLAQQAAMSAGYGPLSADKAEQLSQQGLLSKPRATSVAEEPTSGLNDINGSDLQSDQYAGGRRTVTVGKDQGVLAALAASGLSAAEQRAAYGQLVRTGQLTQGDFDRKGMPITQEGQEFYLDLNDLSKNDSRLGGKLIANESGNRAVLAAVAAERQQREASAEMAREVNRAGAIAQANAPAAGQSSVKAELGGFASRDRALDQMQRDNAAFYDGMRGSFLGDMAANAGTLFSDAGMNMAKGFNSLGSLATDAEYREQVKSGLAYAAQNPDKVVTAVVDGVKEFADKPLDQQIRIGAQASIEMLAGAGLGKIAQSGAKGGIDVAKSLAPKAGEMVESYMAKTGGLVYAVDNAAEGKRIGATGVVPMAVDSPSPTLLTSVDVRQSHAAHSAYQYELLKRDLLRQEVASPGSPTSGPVVLRDPVAGATDAQVQQIRQYADLANLSIDEGYMSSSGRVSTSGALRVEASAAAREERFVAAAEGRSYTGVVGHGPDTTWTGKPVAPYWLDMDHSINSSLGRQAQNYPIGYKPTRFIYEGDLNWTGNGNW
jgi:hypothetical protein